MRALKLHAIQRAELTWVRVFCLLWCPAFWRIGWIWVWMALSLDRGGLGCPRCEWRSRHDWPSHHQCYPPPPPSERWDTPPQRRSGSDRGCLWTVTRENIATVLNSDDKKFIITWTRAGKWVLGWGLKHWPIEFSWYCCILEFKAQNISLIPRLLPRFQCYVGAAWVQGRLANTAISSSNFFILLPPHAHATQEYYY